MADTLQQLSNEMADLVDDSAESILRVDARRRLPATGIAWSENLIVTAHPRGGIRRHQHRHA